MAKDTGMTATDIKEGKTKGLTADKAATVNKMIKEEVAQPAPTKTIKMVTATREKKKNK